MRQWLWKGSFEPDPKPLEVWEGENQGAREPAMDLMERTAEYLAELWRLLDLAREMEDQRSRTSDEELRSVARMMLPVLDALDRVLEYAKEVKNPDDQFNNWVRSVEGVAQRLGRALEKMGLVPISAVGNEVDLAMHDVVETRRTREYPDNTVIEERMKGYYFRGRLLRDAKVVVALSS